MRHTAIACGILFCLGTTADAQAPDPYADGVAQAVKERRQRRHDDFMERAEVLSYAVGCKVVAPERAEAAMVYTYIAQATVLGADQPPIQRRELAETLSRSSALAQEKGCDFWKNNPDLVLEVRQSVFNRRMP